MFYLTATSLPQTCDTSDGWLLNPVSYSCIKMFTPAVYRQQAADNCASAGAQLAMWKTIEAINVLKSIVENTTTGIYLRSLQLFDT